MKPAKRTTARHLHCKYCGARMKRDWIGWRCPTHNCQWEHGANSQSALLLKFGEAVREKILTRNKIGCIFVESVKDTVFPDNLAIVLCSYFERHTDRPENDPETEHGWGEWAEQKTNEALDLIAKELTADLPAILAEVRKGEGS